MSVLTAVKQHIIDDGLAAGYTWRYGRLTVSDTESDNPIILLREMGEGANSDPLLQQIDVLILVIAATEQNIEITDTLAANITKLFRGEGTQPDVVRFEIVGGKTGPFMFENNKPYFETNVRVYVEDR